MNLEIENFIWIKTETSRKKMRIFGTNLYNALDAEKANPLILALFNRTTTPHTDFIDAFNDFTTKNALRKGLTAAFTGLFAGLRKKVEGWEALVVVTYPRENPTYIQIFPNGRAGLYQGGYEAVIGKLNAFHSVLDPLVFAGNPKADVLDYITQMTTARSRQLSGEESIDAASDLLIAKHRAYANIIFGNYGALIDIFRDTPDEANRFFDFSILKRHIKDEEEFKKPIAGGDTALICSNNFEDDTEMLLENPGVTTIKYFTSADESPSPSTTGLEIPPGMSKTVKAIDLGASGNKFLKVTNLDPSNQGNYKVTVY
jgi:hypothetical protein